MNKKKIIDCVLDGTYTTHPQGAALIELDLQDFENMLQVEDMDALLTERAEDKSRIKFLEFQEDDLQRELTHLREKHKEMFNHIEVLQAENALQATRLDELA